MTVLSTAIRIQRFS